MAGNVLFLLEIEGAVLLAVMEEERGVKVNFQGWGLGGQAGPPGRESYNKYKQRGGRA